MTRAIIAAAAIFLVAWHRDTAGIRTYEAVTRQDTLAACHAAALISSPTVISL